MSPAPYSCLIGVDGGGTRCRMALLAGGRRTDLSTARTNVHSDPEAAIATLVVGLEALVAKAGLPPAALSESCGYFGLAGVTGSGASARVAGHLPLGRIEVADDRLAAVRGALGAGDGVVAGIGTGSFFARQVCGAVDLRGGWGFVLGDEASGAWLGRRLLARVLHVEDGLYAPSDLTQAARARFRDGPAEIVAFAGAARPGDFAAFAPDIAAAADQADPVGLALMTQGAAHVVRAVEALGWAAGEPICLVGGLAARYAPYLPERLARQVIPPRATALDGALELAAQLAEGHAS